MAPTTTPGANPAPLYKEKTNTISALMARHTSSPSLSFLSSLPSKFPGNGNQTPHVKTVNQIRAQAEDFELDRVAQYDDNMGVGMFAPENRKEKEEKRAKELEARKLKARLGIKDKRKGSEWEAVSGVTRARGVGSEDEEELGRSGVGRAKKRKRIIVEPSRDTGDQIRTGQVGPEMTQSLEPAPATAPKFDEKPGSEDAGNTTKEASKDSDIAQNVSTPIAGDQANTTVQAKRKRKKKKTNKSKGQPVGISIN